jgi:hypothetical protein
MHRMLTPRAARGTMMVINHGNTTLSRQGGDCAPALWSKETAYDPPLSFHKGDHYLRKMRATWTFSHRNKLSLTPP